MTDPRVLGTANLAIAAVDNLTKAVEGLTTEARQLDSDNANLRPLAAEGKRYAADRLNLRRTLRRAGITLTGIITNGAPPTIETLVALLADIDRALDTSMEGDFK